MKYKKLNTLQPINRYVTIVPHFEEKKTTTGVLLPEDFEQEEARYILATVVDVAPDCNKSLTNLRMTREKNAEVIVESSMIDKITIKQKTFYTILENYILGILRPM